MNVLPMKAITWFACALLLIPAPAMAQQAPPPVFVPGATPPGGAPVPASETNRSGQVRRASTIKILVLEGRLRVNRLSEGTFSAPVVEIRDSNDRPIEGATVTFVLPSGGGAGAMFPDGSREKTFTTNSQGQAMAEGYAPNNVEGKFEVRVRASYQNEKNEIVIQQANSFETQADSDRKKSKSWHKWAWIGGAAAAGGITAAILLTRGGSSSNTITVTPGAPVFGGR